MPTTQFINSPNQTTSSLYCQIAMSLFHPFFALPPFLPYKGIVQRQGRTTNIGWLNWKKGEHEWPAFIVVRHWRHWSVSQCVSGHLERAIVHC